MVKGKSFYLLGYDIENPRCLAKVAKRVCRQMVRLQKSVYLGLFDNDMRENLYQDILGIIGDDDKVFLIPVCREDVCRIRSTTELRAFQLLDSSVQII